MHILVTGANGFVGRALARRLCAEASLGGEPIRRLSLLDLAFDGSPEDSRVHHIAGDMADAAWLRSTLAGTQVDVVFHLASIPGGTAEREYELARRVNRPSNTGLQAYERGAHTPDLEPLLNEMTEVRRSVPGAQW